MSLTSGARKDANQNLGVKNELVRISLRGAGFSPIILSITLELKQLSGVDSGGAVSSVVEHFLDTEGVRGSNPLSRTILHASGLETPLESGPVPFSFSGSFHCVASNLAFVDGCGIRTLTDSRGVGDRERDVIALELGVFDRPFEYFYFAVNLAAAINGAR